MKYTLYVTCIFIFTMGLLLNSGMVLGVNSTKMYNAGQIQEDNPNTFYGTGVSNECGYIRSRSTNLDTSYFAFWDLYGDTDYNDSYILNVSNYTASYNMPVNYDTGYNLTFSCCIDTGVVPNGSISWNSRSPYLDNCTVMYETTDWNLNGQRNYTIDLGTSLLECVNTSKQYGGYGGIFIELLPSESGTMRSVFVQCDEAGGGYDDPYLVIDYYMPTTTTTVVPASGRYDYGDNIDHNLYGVGLLVILFAVIFFLA